MKSAVKIITLILSIFLIHSCKKDKVPTLTTTEVTNILATSATSGGTVTDEGSATIVERGICWSKAIIPTIADNKTIEGGGAGTFVSNLTALDGATTYNVRAYAKNAAGTGYGMAISFTTLGSAPSFTLSPTTNITTTTATLNSSVNANYLETIVTFEYGLTPTYGQSILFTGNPLDGNLNSSVSAELSELNPGTTYHFRIKAENSLGIIYSEDFTFTTLGQSPTAITQAACCLSSNSAKLNGIVNANYLSTIVTFEYGTTAEYGSSVIATQSPVTGSNNTSVSANISGLNTGTIYHFRIKAENSLGIVYGNDLTFITLLIDIDGNVYQYTIIGTQVWMAENLKTTKFNDDSPIPFVTDTIDWQALTIPGYCWYNNDEKANRNTYGALYNWYAVNTGNLCPVNWHVPDNNEWHTLMLFLDKDAKPYHDFNSEIASGFLKEAGYKHWISPNAGATNETGFTALPGGNRNVYGVFNYLGEYGTWWLATQQSRTMSYSNTRVTGTEGSYKAGRSVRCLKDE